ncbi:MAG: signal peptide peptidase SppA [Bacteroidales bacterium]|nr:signal peptide peptidase SppA [Bacteroidales bacterium]
MKGFFNYVLASMLGTFLLIVVLGIINVIIMLGMMSAIGSLSDDKKEISEKAILHLDFKTPVADRSSAKPNLSTFELDKTVSLRSFTETIKKAKEDDRIKGIFLDLSTVNVGMASIEEIRNVLLDFKSSEKFIIAHADYYSHKSYYLATVADNIYLTPEGRIQFSGLSAQIMFFKSMLEKIGIEPEIIRHGKFKSAVEPFMLDEISEANREQTLKYVGSVWNTIIKGIEKEREISADQLNLYADSLMISNSKTAKTLNFVDDLKFKDQILAELETLSGIEKDEDEELDLVDLMRYMTDNKNFNDILNPSENRIAIIYAEGAIVSGSGGDDQIGSETLSEAIREAREDENVKAIVLRINSPGGSALASVVIWREIVLAEKEKPVIVSMGDVAASGGYFIACAADTIVSQPNSITGSIGVFGLLFNAKELMNDIGININAVNTNKYSDFGSPARKMSDFERAVIQNSVEEIYQKFITKVSEGRGLTLEEVDEIGQGRVWSGEDALEIGLVDIMGGLQTAVDLAAEMSGLEEYSIKTYPEKDKLTLIIESMLGDAKSFFVEEELGEAYIYYKRMKDVTKIQGIQMRMPYYVDIK